MSTATAAGPFLAAIIAQVSTSIRAPISGSTASCFSTRGLPAKRSRRAELGVMAEARTASTPAGHAVRAPGSRSVRGLGYRAGGQTCRSGLGQRLP
jgi:hypothetical protein